MKFKSGKLIVFEGLDKSGKTTQSKILHKYLTCNYNESTQYLSFPDYSTSIGQEIKDFLQGNSKYNNQVKHLLLAANRWEKKEKIEEYLNQGNSVIINRYYQSNLAYGKANGLDYEWLSNIDKGLPKEDITIFLDIDPEISIKRGLVNNFQLDEFEKNKEFLRKVRENYLEMAKKNNWVKIDSNALPHTITNEIIYIVENLIKS